MLNSIGKLNVGALFARKSPRRTFGSGSPQAEAPSIITAGLVLHLDAGNPSSYPGTGTTWTDLSPSGLNATLGSGVSYSAVDGGSLSFIGGSLGVATISSASALTNADNNFTIEAWYKSQGNLTPRILATGSGSNGFCFGAFSSTSTKFKVTKYAAGGDLFVGSVPQDTNTWHQVVLVYSSATGTKIYVDGVLSETNASKGNLNDSSPSTITIGALESLYHKGNISVVRWYNSVLSDADVLQNYTATATRYTVQPAAVSNLVLYFDPSDYVSYPNAGTSLNSLGASAFTAGFGSVTWVKPYINFASNSQLVVSDHVLLEPGTSNFSFEAWVYHSSISGTGSCIASKTDNGGLASNWSYGMRTNSGGDVYFEVGNGTTSITSPSFTAQAGTWYQVVGVWTNTAPKSIALYKNGELVGSNSHSFASVKNSIRPLYIGSYNGGEYNQWHAGRIGVVRQYNKALSGAEVLQNFNNDRGLYGL
jgi:hypothetical protein